MLNCYLFEAKSIQSYLFKTGKLRDVVSASERLDLLVDDTPTSVLTKVIEQLESVHSHNLSGNSANLAEADINFIRCKGGAFYCYSMALAPLEALRSLWTLTIQQLFPSLEFCDALVSAETLALTMAKGHKQLAVDRNQAKVKFPITPAIASLSQRTGLAAVPLSTHSYKAVADKDELLDLDTELHRQAYERLNLKKTGALQNKYTPLSEDKNKCESGYRYPLNLNTEFEFVAGDFTKSAQGDDSTQLTQSKDIALVHIDGNGLGIILNKLNTALKDVQAIDYAAAFRNFSQSLAIATQQAAREATKIVIQHGCYNENMLAMRPLVLGGDDVTLLIRADLALPWSKAFCKAFKVESKKQLTETIDLINKFKAEDETPIKDYLTASGGILYQKAGHPFTHSHNLVEGLCKKAKALTKQIDSNVGPAALSFMRLSNTTSQAIDTVFEQNFRVSADQHKQLYTSLGAYLVDSDLKHPSLDELHSLHEVCTQTHSPMTLGKWRQLLTYLSLDNLSEAKKVFNRDMKLSKNEHKQPLIDAFINLSHTQSPNTWYWESELNDQEKTTWVTPLSDLILLERFSLNVQKSERV